MKITIKEIYEDFLRHKAFLQSDEIALRELICFVNNYENMSQFYTRKDDKIKDISAIRAYWARYLNGEPVQYITKRAHFLGEYFYVDERVLIPRMETEEVVNLAVQLIKEIYNNEPLNIADIGTGSGAIALTLKKAFPNSNIYATDISKEALSVAKKNASRFDRKINFLEGDSLNPLILNRIKVNVIVSNPPYVEVNDSLDKSVRDYEPNLALIKQKPKSIYQNILEKISFVATFPLLVVFEIGHDMKEEIINLIQKFAPQAKFEVIKDINNKNRIAYFYLENLQ